MNEKPAGHAAAPPPLQRILTLEVEAAGFPLAQGLAAAGYTVDTVTRPEQLAAALERETYQAVVLDLSTRGRAEEVLGVASETLDSINAREGTWRPAVLAVWPSRARGDLASSLHVDVTIPTRKIEQLIHEVEGAVVARRLDHALEENDRLRKSVLFARHTAHELAQPLTTILARAQLLRSVLKPDDPHVRTVSIICDEADRLARMVEEFQHLKGMSGSGSERKG